MEKAAHRVTGFGPLQFNPVQSMSDQALDGVLEVYERISDNVGRYDAYALMRAAACYCMAATAPFLTGNHDIVDYQALRPPEDWPFRTTAWQPTSPRQDLVMAAAMLIGEIKRMDEQASGGARKAVTQ